MELKRVLIAMDMDGTIIPGNSIRELNELTGTSSKNDAKFKEYVEGKITAKEYKEFLQNCYSTSNPLYKQDVEKEMKKFSTFEGFDEFIKALYTTYRNKLILAIVSSGIEERVKALAEKYGIKEKCYSTLRYEEGKLIGIKSFLFPTDKEQYLLQLIQKYNPSFTIVIGDSEWDKPMMKHADLKISVGNEHLKAHKTIYSYHELAEYLANNGHKGMIELALNRKIY